MISDPKFLDMFKKVSCNEDEKLYGDWLVVEVLPVPERKSAGGIIMSETKSNPLCPDSTMLGVVLKTGEGYTDDNGDLIPDSLKCKIGNVVLVSGHVASHVKHFEMLGYTTGHDIIMIRDADVRWTWDGVEGYKKFINKLKA